MQYRFTLEPYKGPNSRYTCPQCRKQKVFTRYIDTETRQHIATEVGRCNREINCGYHYKPKEYFARVASYELRVAGSALRKVTAVPKVPGVPKGDCKYIGDKSDFAKQPRTTNNEPQTFIPQPLFQKSLTLNNNLTRWLAARFGEAAARAVAQQYYIGTSKHWSGASLVPGYTLQQCLFGEHLLTQSANLHKPVAIVESEKTALLCSMRFPQNVWLAAGSLSNLSVERCAVLKGRVVTLFPDLKCLEKWRLKAKELSVIASVAVSDLLERRASAEDVERGLDLGDWM